MCQRHYYHHRRRVKDGKDTWDNLVKQGWAYPDQRRRVTPPPSSAPVPAPIRPAPEPVAKPVAPAKSKAFTSSSIRAACLNGLILLVARKGQLVTDFEFQGENVIDVTITDGTHWRINIETR
jgi:hypothetical protein